MTNSELAILSLIAQEPCYGYQVEQIIEERAMRNWTEIGFSSIYYVLKKLEGHGWVESRIEHDGGPGPARRVYHITPAGREAWQEATLDALSHPRRCYTSFQLGLASLPGVSPDKALAALDQYCDRLAQRRDYVRANWMRVRGDRELPCHIDAMFDLSVTRVEAELAWVKRFIRRLASRKKGGRGANA